jgi:hypothetical protein
VGRSYAIALNAYREAIRDRVLIGVLGLAATSLLFGLSLAWLSLAEQVRILVDHGLTTVSWLANLVAIFLGASFLYKEIELRTLYVILAKPLARWEFVLGKYLGILATAAVFIAVTASMLLLLLSLQTVEAHGPPGAGVGWLSHQLATSRPMRFGTMAAGAVVVMLVLRALGRARWLEPLRSALGSATSAVLALGLLGVCIAVARSVAPVETRFVLRGCALVCGEVCVTAGIAVFFSAFSTPFVTGLLTLGVFLIGRCAGLMLEFRGRSVPAEVRDLLQAVATVVPNLQLFVPSRQTLLEVDDGAAVWRYIGQAWAHGGLYALLLVLVSTLLFRRRDLI